MLLETAEHSPGTSGLETSKVNKRASFSGPNLIKEDGIQVFSPVLNRRKIAEQKPTPGFSWDLKSSEFPPEWACYPSPRKRLIDWNQWLKTKSALKNQGLQYVKKKLSLTPLTKLKSEERHRKSLMTILLASTPELGSANDQFFNTVDSARKRKESPSSFVYGKLPNFSFQNSPGMNSSSDLALGTPDLETTKAITRVGFSHFNQLTKHRLQVFSPAWKRRKIAGRMSTPSFGRHLRSSEFPPDWSSYPSPRIRLIKRKQELKGVSALKNQGSKEVEQQLLLTPPVELKSENERRKELLAFLLASSP